MKPKLTIMAALCAIGLGAHAQTDKGSGFLGLNLSFGTEKQKDYSSSINNFTFTTKGAYFLQDNFAIGLDLSFNLSKLRGVHYTEWNSEYGVYQDTYGSKELNIGLSPFVRKYLNIKSFLKFYAQANILFQINSTKIIDNEDYLIGYNNRLKGYGVSLSPGFAFFPSEKFAIEFSFPMVSYFHQNYYDEFSAYNYQQQHNFKLALENFTPSIGVSFHL
ncbi:hypothetical protein DHW03_06840 [Pedobacter yonginense]|uniref:Outer membrane protein beta-barrel domain-containing protein n=1 Tax=Pedobacter yonginense TaxID=651869 RepID=A0A317ERI3_9SPHI|nr:hypothetical protein [Pedobacter yonginense]PWS29520.1 hypothetical protein DHW03_06840 [Pedobacter yonginense]